MPDYIVKLIVEVPITARNQDAAEAKGEALMEKLLAGKSVGDINDTSVEVEEA